MIKLISESLTKIEIITHGYFTRHGGISEGIYASLNCGFGSKDNKEYVKENRSRVMQDIGLPFGSLRTTYQNHSANVVVIKDINFDTSKVMADAMVCNIKGITIGSNFPPSITGPGVITTSGGKDRVNMDEHIIFVFHLFVRIKKRVRFPFVW